MLTPEIDKYLTKVCGDILDIKTRHEVRRELEAHLEDKMEHLMQSGMPENIAADKAVLEMGDPYELRTALGILHSRVPSLDMRSALTKLAVGLFLSTFSINIWILAPITQGFGFFLMLIAAYQLRKCNFKLKLGFIAAIVNYAMHIVSNFLSITPSPGTTVSIALTALATAIDCIMMYFIYIGLAELAEKYSLPGDTHPIRKYGIINIILSTAICLVFVLPEAILLAFPLLVLYVIMAIKNINSVKKILREADEGDNVCELRAVEYTFISVLAVLFVSLPLIFAHNVVTPDIKAEPYIIDDIPYKVSENADLMRMELKELKAETAIVNVLPEDELMNFKGALKATNSFCNHETARGGNISVYSTSFTFEDKVILAELVDFEELPRSRYIDSVYYHTYSYDHALSATERDRLLLLYQSDRTYSYEPLEISYYDDGMMIEHIDFKLPENADDVKILKLQTLAPNENYVGLALNLNTGLTYVNRSSLICRPYSATESASSYLLTESGIGFSKFSMMGLISTDGTVPDNMEFIVNGQNVLVIEH